eukprot:g668.t1
MPHGVTRLQTRSTLFLARRCPSYLCESRRGAVKPLQAVGSSGTFRPPRGQDLAEVDVDLAKDAGSSAPSSGYNFQDAIGARRRKAELLQGSFGAWKMAMLHAGCRRISQAGAVACSSELLGSTFDAWRRRRVLKHVLFSRVPWRDGNFQNIF